MPTNNQPDSSTSGTAARPALKLIAQETAPGGCCGGRAVAAPTQPAQDGVAECPVMVGTPVNKAQAEAAGLFRDYNGQRYWLCCASCAPVWDADPDEYATA